MRYLITIMMVWTMCWTNVSAQNPFDLKWRGNANADTSSIAAPPPLEKRSTATDITLPPPTEPVLDTPGLVEDTALAVQNFEANDTAEIDTEVDRPVQLSEADPPLEENRMREIPQEPQPRQPVKAALIIVMIGLAILILTWSVNYNRGFLKQIYRAAMNENLSSLLLREQRFASSQYLYYIVYTTFFINAALFLYLLVRRSTWDLPYATSPLLYFVLFVLVVYITKHVIIKFLGSTFEIAEKTAHYNFTILLFNILAGIALIPINLLLAFGSASLGMPVIIIGLIILGLLYLLRQFRGLVIVSDTLGGHGFQFFMYLCAIEILPILVLFKFFTTH